MSEEIKQKPMTDVLSAILEMRSGAVARDLNEKFNAVIEGVLATGKKGQIGLTLLVKPSKMGLGGAVLEVQTSHDIKTKVPELEIGTSTFFVSHQGTLMRNDPSQEQMFEEELEEKPNAAK